MLSPKHACLFVCFSRDWTKNIPAVILSGISFNTMNNIVQYVLFFNTVGYISEYFTISCKLNNCIGFPQLAQVKISFVKSDNTPSVYYTIISQASIRDIMHSIYAIRAKGFMAGCPLLCQPFKLSSLLSMGVLSLYV